METHGFQVTRHYLGLDTAWRAEYTHGKGGSTLGINSGKNTDGYFDFYGSHILKKWMASAVSVMLAATTLSPSAVVGSLSL